LGIFLGEAHDLDVVSDLDYWLDSGIYRFTIKFSFEHMVEWAELEPLWPPWIGMINDIPVNCALVVVSHHKSSLVNIQVHACGDVLHVESFWIPHPQLIWITLNVFFEVALKSWEFSKVWRFHGIIILAAEDKILTGHFFSNVQTHLTMSLHTEFYGFFGLGPFDWVLVAVENFNFILNISVEWKWQAALKERLGKGATVGIE